MEGRMRERLGFGVVAIAAAAFAAAGCSSDEDAEETTLTVMSFNIWGGGANEKKPIDETVAAIEAVDPDIVGIQETQLEGPKCTAKFCPPRGDSVGPELAEALGYELYEQKTTNDALWSNAIMAKGEISDPTPNDLGVPCDIDGRDVYAFNIHLDDAPYQPYQLLDIPYGGAPFIDTEERGHPMGRGNPWAGHRPAEGRPRRGRGRRCHLRLRRLQRAVRPGLDARGGGGRESADRGGLAHYPSARGRGLRGCVP